MRVRYVWVVYYDNEAEEKYDVMVFANKSQAMAFVRGLGSLNYDIFHRLVRGD